MENKNTTNWRIRESGDFFFVEADLPNAEENGHYPRLEVMQEDFGDHNGYTAEIRRSDAELIVSAPKMRDAITEVLEVLDGSGLPNTEWIRQRLTESISKP